MLTHFSVFVENYFLKLFYSKFLNGRKRKSDKLWWDGCIWTGRRKKTNKYVVKIRRQADPSSAAAFCRWTRRQPLRRCRRFRSKSGFPAWLACRTSVWWFLGNQEFFRISKIPITHQKTLFFLCYAGLPVLQASAVLISATGTLNHQLNPDATTLETEDSSKEDVEAKSTFRRGTRGRCRRDGRRRRLGSPLFRIWGLWSRRQSRQRHALRFPTI